MKLKRVVLLFVWSGICLLFNAALYAQTTEAGLKTEAEKAYKAESFVEASKLYSQLLAFNATDPFYNYRYGVCLIYNSRKKQDAIKHLTYASKQDGFDPEVFYYLGKAYHLNYEFPEAIANYNKYKAAAGTKLNPELDVNRQLEMSENGKRLLSSMNQMVVLEKKEIETGNFFRIYDLRDIGGDFIVNAQFQSKVDKKKKHIPLIHFPARPTMIFYSSYGEDEKRGKDIFIRRKLPDGSWSLPQTVNGGVNTPFDEDYPYLHPNGKYLYFCSKGHNSMGGYDVFRSKYDKENNTFGPAENLDFAISSPDNDLLYVVDSLDKNAYFASARQSQDGKMHVYKVRVEQFPDQLAVVKAGFSSTINPALKKASVEIYDYTTASKIGTFNSNDKGNIIITFPKGGKYEYQITVNGGDEVFKYVVSIPFLKEFKPLKQQLIHEIPDGQESVRIVNLFDENVEDPIATLRELAQMRSELNPNADQFDLNKMDQRSANKEIYAQLGMEKLSDLEVKESIEKLAEKQEDQTENIKSLERKAIDISMQNSKEIAKLQLELKNKVALADSKQGGEKRELYEDAGRIVNEINRLESQAKSLIPAADSLAAVAKTLEANDQKTRQLSDAVSEAYEKGDMAKVSELLTENKAQIQELQKENTDLATDKLTKEIVTLREEAKKLGNQQKELLDTKLQVKQDLLALDKQLAEAKTKDQPAIQKKVDSKIEEAKMVDQELKRVDDRMKANAESERKVESKLAYYQEIQNSAAPATMANTADAQKALQATDNQNSRTLEAYVEQQTKELGIDILALKTEKKGNTSGNNGNVATGNPDKQNEGNTTGSNGNVASNNPDKQNTGNATGNNGNVTTNNPDKQNTGNQQGGNNNAGNTATGNQGTNDPKGSASNPAVTTTKAVEISPQQEPIISSVSPDFLQNVKEINNDPQLTEEQKMKALQRQEKDMKFLISKEMAAVQEQLKQSPGDAALQNRLKELKDINDALKGRIETKQAELQAKYPESNPPVKLTESQLANQIKPNHNAILNSLAEDERYDDMQRMDKAQTEDQKFLGALMQQKNRIEDELSREPKNEKNNYELGLIKNMITDTENRIEERTKGMASYQTSSNPTGNNGNNNPSGNNAGNQNPEVNALLNQVNPAYSKQVEAIKNDAGLSPKDKQSRLIAEEDKLQASIGQELSAAESQLKQNPTDAKMLEQKQQLEQLRDESQNRESESKQLLVSEEKKAISKEELLNKTDKTYSKEIAALQAKPSEQNSQKAVVREGKLQQALEKRIAENEKKNAVKEDLKLQAENQLLAELLDESKARAKGTTSDPLAGNQGNKTTEGNQTGNNQSGNNPTGNNSGNNAAGNTTGNANNATGSNPPVEQADPKLVEQLRSELLLNDKNTATQEFTTLDELKKQQTVLNAYAAKLDKKLAAAEKKLAAKPDNAKALEDKKAIVQEQNWVKEKLRKGSVSIGELEQQIVAENKAPQGGNQTPVEELAESKELTDLKAQESKLQDQLNQPELPKKEKKIIEAQLAENKTQQAELNSKQLAAQAEVLKQNPPDKMSRKSKSPQSDVLVSIDSLHYMNLKEDEALLKEKQEDLDKTKKPSSRLELLKEIDNIQQENKIQSAEMVYDTRLIVDVKSLGGDVVNTPLSLESSETLEKRKVRVGVSIGELETSILEDKALLPKAKSKEKTALQRKIKRKETELALRKKELVALVQELNQRKSVSDALTVANAASAITVDSAETASLSSKSNYSDLKAAYEQKEVAKMDANMDFEALEKAKSNYNKALKAYATSPDKNTKKAMTEALDDVKLKNTAYQQSKKAYDAEENKYLSLAAEEPALTKLESLFLKGVTQSQPQAVNNNLATNRPASSGSDYGFRVLDTPASEPVDVRVPIGSSMPMGLVYRVQVGAFRKPLKATLFNEFTPVTGEQIKSGITRYISGYFGSILNASQAKKQIRGLGYKDAFIVAYCDGKRITIAEARRLEAKGECVPSAELATTTESTPNVEKVVETKNQPKGQAGEKIEPETVVKTKTVKGGNEGKNVASGNQKTNVGDYNKAPGAVEAIAVETKPGLFYTVQIGAYRNPATPAQLKNIENVVSKKLDDGKIRYSTGIFASIEEALPTKQMAIAKGVSDAFVTAYYKGDRITLAEAERLLKEQGPGILEKK